MKIHSRHLHAPLRGIFGPNSVNVVRYASLIGTKSPTKWNAQLAESNFQTRPKTVNKKNASLIFTTHYCEVLDLFNRQDNIWVCRSDGKITVRNMYETYELRSGLLKSRQFYNNAFQTAVNYEELMNLKRKLMG